eukprot:8324802-Ditylum_brightwellii.AAC.3
MCLHTPYPLALEDVVETIASDGALQGRCVSLTPYGWGNTEWCSLVSWQELRWCNGPMYPSS